MTKKLSKRNEIKKSIKIGLSIMTVGLLVGGCGSGGGSSALFKDANIAPASIDSGKEVSKNITANSTGSSLSSLSNNEEKNADSIIDSGSNIVMLSSALTNYSKKHMKKTTYALNEVVDDSEECSNGGTIHYKGSGDDSSGGTVSMTYDNCKEGSETMDGSMYMDMKMSHGEESSIVLSFPSDFTITTKDKTTKIFKNSKIVMSNMDKNAVDMESTIKVDVDGKLYGSEKSKWKVIGSKMYQLSGKEYINNLDGYVIYDSDYDMSKTPFVFGYNGLVSGESHYKADNNGKIILKVTGTNQITVKIDADNDGVFETEEVFNN